MEDTIGQLERAYAVRGSICAFLLPWQKVQDKITKVITKGDLSASQHLVRVRGPEENLNKFKELHIRARVVRDVAFIYIDYHVEGLGKRPGVLQSHMEHARPAIRESLRSHVTWAPRENYTQ